MKYRSKTDKDTIIKAFEYDGDLQNRNGEYYVPRWAIKAYNEGFIYYDQAELFVKGQYSPIQCGDFIIRDMKGNIVSIASNLFESYFEPLRGQSFHGETLTFGKDYLTRLIIEDMKKEKKDVSGVFFIVKQEEGVGVFEGLRVAIDEV